MGLEIVFIVLWRITSAGKRYEWGCHVNVGAPTAVFFYKVNLHRLSKVSVDPRLSTWREMKAFIVH